MCVIEIDALLPWLASGFMAGVVTLLVTFQRCHTDQQARIRGLCACLGILAAGNIFWFYDIDGRGARTNAASWRLKPMEGYDLLSLWRNDPGRIGDVASRIDVYVAIRDHCRGQRLYLLGIEPADVGLQERYLREWSRVEPVRCKDSAVESGIRDDGAAPVVNVRTLDGLVFEFAVERPAAAWQMSRSGSDDRIRISPHRATRGY